MDFRLCHKYMLYVDSCSGALGMTGQTTVAAILVGLHAFVAT